MAYRRVMVLVDGIETRQVAPARARINVILDDVKTVTAKVKEETERVDHAIHATMDRLDDTVDRIALERAGQDQRWWSGSSAACASQSKGCCTRSIRRTNVNLEEAT